MPSIRPAHLDDALAIARVHVDTWRTTYAGIVPSEFLADLSYERCRAGWVEALASPQTGPHAGTQAFVAEDQPGQIVGIASCGPLREPLENFDGELYTLYVLKSCQGQGYGKRLVARVANTLASKGCHSMVIWVLKDNPACRFYEWLGGRLTAEKEVEIGGARLVDVAFTWPDLAIFAQAE